MPTDPRHILAVGIFGGKSHIAQRIEFLLRRNRAFSSTASARIIATSTLSLTVLLLAASFTPRWIAFAQSQPRPTFEVVSIKPDSNCVGDHQDESFSPGRVTVTCITLANLVQAAYGTFAHGSKSNPKPLRLIGTRAWIHSDRFDIAAKAQGDPPMSQMFGPMLQTTLEDRFHLRAHLEIREVPVYSLTVARSGPTLHPTKEGSCIPLDLNHSNEAAPEFCGRMTGRANGAHVTDEAHGMTMGEIAGRMLSNRLDRPVLDNTGLTGLFDAHLEFDRDTVNPTSPDAATSSIFIAVQEQLGLKLESSKGPVDVLVIDHVEKPDAN